MILVHGIVVVLGLIILVYRHPIGEWAEENWGHLVLPNWPGYLRANVLFLGLILTFGGLYFLLVGLSNR